MNAVIGMTSLIRHDAGNKDKVIEYADKIDISSQHLLGIINDILDMSKIEAGKTVFKYDDFSILNFIQEINNLFHSQIDEKKQILTTKKNIRHEWVNGDQLRLMQIFSNLLSNAVKYTQEGGEIQFLVEECETNSSVYAKYRFLVRDNGIGMSADFKDKIFDAFTRAENSVTNKIQGTGLGMAITRNLVEAMGGTIDVESELGQGSCFEVLIELRIAEDRTVALAAQEDTDEQDGNILQGMRFLCAEDNELNAEILTELLKIEGAECTICENGEDVLKAFEQSAPGDLIMMSWNLWIRMKEEKCWKMQDWIRMSLIFNRRVQLMKSNIETKMDLMERRQAVHANKIQALMLMITAMQIPEKEKNRKILKAVRVSTALLWLLTCVEDLMLMIRKNYN